MRAVFSALHLPDGGFYDLVRMARTRAQPMPVVVFLPQLDGGWIDLLEAGAFDVIGEPYNRRTIERLLAAIPLYGGVPQQFRGGAGRAGAFAA